MNPCESFGHDGYDCGMSNTAEPLKVPPIVFKDATKASLRSRSDALRDGEDIVRAEVVGLKSGLDYIIGWCQDNGWTIEPPKSKATPKPPLKGGIG